MLSIVKLQMIRILATTIAAKQVLANEARIPSAFRHAVAPTPTLAIAG